MSKQMTSCFLGEEWGVIRETQELESDLVVPQPWEVVETGAGLKEGDRGPGGVD